VVERGLSSESSMKIGSTALAEAAQNASSASASREIRNMDSSWMCWNWGVTEDDIKSQIMAGVKRSGIGAAGALARG
jgi:acyl-CoA reductase-like NAD-dependent aldehyde dehydrogenase